MRGAPSVSFPVGRSRFVGVLALLFWGCGMALVVRAIVQAPAFGWREAVLLTVASSVGAIALSAWLRSPRGVLLRDDDGWLWTAAAAAAGQGDGRRGTPMVALDLQQRLLVRFMDDADGARWLWLDRASAVERWHELRCAIHACVPVGSNQTARPPSA